MYLAEEGRVDTPGLSIPQAVEEVDLHQLLPVSCGHQWCTLTHAHGDGHYGVPQVRGALPCLRGTPTPHSPRPQFSQCSHRMWQ